MTKRDQIVLKKVNTLILLQVKVDGVPCEDSLITVTKNDTKLKDMKITMKCDRVGRVVSFEIPPNNLEVVMLTLCEVEVFGFRNSTGSVMT